MTADQTVVQLSPMAQFHYDCDNILALVCVHDLDNIWMIQMIQNIQFIVKILEVMFVQSIFVDRLASELVSSFFVDNLQYNRVVRVRICAHAPVIVCAIFARAMAC